jgi:hypothetical protein
MHEASMLVFWTADVKRVQQRSDIFATWMFPRSLLDTFVYLQLIVQLLPHRCGLYENLESHIATMAVIFVSEGIVKRR